MVKTYQILRPHDIPYRLLSFQFYFENENSHMMNIYHAAGMSLLYHIARRCYVIPGNEFYQLLKLQNTAEPHEPKYDHLLMKGIFGGQPEVEANLTIENEDIFNLLQQDNHLYKHICLYKLPEPGNDLVIFEEQKKVYHHFTCAGILKAAPEGYLLINADYHNSYDHFYPVINSWLGEETKLQPLT